MLETRAGVRLNQTDDGKCVCGNWYQMPQESHDFFLRRMVGEVSGLMEVVDHFDAAAVDEPAIMALDLPVVPLWHEDQIAVVSERARGFLPSAEGRWLGLAGLE